MVLRWLLQRGIVPVVKSANPVRMKENIDIFNFELSEDDMKNISNLDTHHSCFGKRKTAEQVTGFLKKAMEYKV